MKKIKRRVKTKNKGGNHKNDENQVDEENESDSEDVKEPVEKKKSNYFL